MTMIAANIPVPLLPLPHLGAMLRRWRRLHRVKQADLAERLGVVQSTISRWEAGTQQIEAVECARIEALLGARLDTAADQMLATLVNENPRQMHLVCDLTHRLLACSASRSQQFQLAATELIGRSLWPYATEQVVAAETALANSDWRESPLAMPIEFHTGDNGSAVVPIRPSLCRWTRLVLSDGTATRLVETLAA
ncbi:MULTISPECIES: helix-turn-helix transcriptional regulator [unclassified Beijerinckia]|uniref:helix-turn-helix domain-containing protein n=1 Tax=unclassified Beijerinckia TaxID=2638183 RepID=UPI00089728F4|nr:MULTISPECIES: helix-turn-helix transcriptional regulator [unclassified Beijerinckia]MDH7799891.1 transcriptional regulator with XRE-family HTH domain [Beijerinckia sp. GAS462]SED41320.1 Helix-turn-helix domain-containing protein [Beijerinckia sp. 28-YEA-48]